MGTQPLPEDQELEEDRLITMLHKDLQKLSWQFWPFVTNNSYSFVYKEKQKLFQRALILS